MLPERVPTHVSDSVILQNSFGLASVSKIHFGAKTCQETRAQVEVLVSVCVARLCVNTCVEFGIAGRRVS